MVDLLGGAPRVQNPGAILLLSCYELGHQPMGLAMPLAFLERAGYAPRALDLAVERFDPELVAGARLVGISVPMHTALRLGVRAARRVREVNPRAHVCFFGLYAQLNAHWLLAAVADSVLGSEAESALVELVRALERGEAPPRATPSPPARQDFPAAPSRSALPPLERYARFERGGESRLAGYVEASRGCLHQCTHCPIPPVYDGRLVVVPVDRVLADVRAQVAAGARHVTFGDPDFLNGPGHSLKVLRAAHAGFPELTFDFTAKVEHLLRHRRLLPEFVELGCAFAVTAAESLSDEVLRHLEKGHTRADVFAALALARRVGLELRPTWVPFTPWTSREDYRDLLRFVADEDLVGNVDPVQLAIRLLVPPGSRLLESPAMRPHLGALVEETLCHPWTHPDPWMDELCTRVACAIAESTRLGEEPEVAFARVREPAGLPAVTSRPRRGRAPRLTESWFC